MICFLVIWLKSSSLCTDLVFLFFSGWRVKRDGEKERIAYPHPFGLVVNSCPVLFIFTRALDDLERENRGSLNRLLKRPETNFIRNSIRSRGAIAWNTLTNNETRAKTLKEFKRCLVKFDTDKMNVEPILATTKNRDIGYEYF